MSHMKQFKRIPMSKSMRSLCKEEDYAFLGISASTMKETAGLAALEDRWRDEKERRVRRQLEREKQEQDRVRAIEESKKEKERQWQTHIAELNSSQETFVQKRLARLREFREFQRNVLASEERMDGEAADQLLKRM
ncbi:calponin homology domain-containing protein DDB_G0272472 [Oryzias latipes]|uniref:calponin homology domain-containing protein DDB_G0272472 n=1 Tax=Oryzias latipes TaxID=8090 RepID=UPI0009DA027E|nr:calponin homology domain-containing protein DDB_G0272472 [Oryzias latipes]